MGRREKYFIVLGNGGKEFSCSKATLDEAISRLKKKKTQKKLRVGNCTVTNTRVVKVDKEVMLRCRQLSNVLVAIRKSILRQDWNEAAILLLTLCHPGYKYHSAIIIRTCFLLLISHPKSNLQLIKKFIRDCTSFVLEEDITKFIKILFTLCEKPLDILTKKYLNISPIYKITDDNYFQEL